jgi:DNA replication protein DnaC
METEGASIACKQSGETISIKESGFDPLFAEIEIFPQFFKCPQCVLRSMGVPRKLTASTFDDFQIDSPAWAPMVKTVRDFAATPKGILLLLGNVGTGKSHLAVAALRQRVDAHRHDAMFITQSALLRRHRQSYKSPHRRAGDETPQDILEACQEANLLVLDDLGLSSGSRDEPALVYDLLTHRYDNFSATIITSNLTPSELETEIGSRLYDRLREAAFAMLQFGFDSKRGDLNSVYLQTCA